MLSELCKELNNWFSRDIYLGTYHIEDGTFEVDFLQEGQFFRIVGSVFNDGVYQYPPSGLADETFNGAVWAMSVPQEVITLSEEIDAWNEMYGGVGSANMSPYQSESFGGYSYSKGSANGYGSGTGSGSGNTWQSAFASRLNNWRKIRP